MKRIAVISDTHIPKAAADIPEGMYDVEMAFLKKLERIAPTYAVFGNMDMPEVRAALPQKDTITLDGFKIGLMHGYGSPAKLVDIVGKQFSRVDVIVFGHSHLPYCETVKKTLFFNPGSPTDRIFAPYTSYGILELGDTVAGRIIRLEE
jgi:putative phosphoesterase